MSTKILIGIGALAGAIIAAATGDWSLAFSLGAVGVRNLIGPSPGQPSAAEAQGAILTNRVGADTPIPIIYGKTRIAGVIADRRIDSASTNNGRYVLVIAFCGGSRDNGDIDGIEDVWFDDRLAISVTGTVQTPFLGLVEGEGLTKHLEYAYHLGSTSQVVDSRLNTLFPTAWPATAPGKHIAYARFELWYNRDVYPTGVPQIRATIRGRRVFDPRDQTWKYSDNPALCVRDFLLDPIHGMKLAEANLDEQSFIDTANYCDELVVLPGGSVKRYTLNGWVDTARPTHVNLAELASTCRGTVVNEGDKWRLVVRRQQAASGYKLNEDTMLEGQWSFVTLGSTDAPNIVRVDYIDPDREYQAETVQWPEPGAANPYLDEDNGLESRLEIELHYVTSRLRAQHTGMTLLKELRQSPGMTAVLKESAVQLRVGERVDVTQPTPGWTDKPFWVQVLRIRPDAQVEAILTPYEPTVYDLDSQQTQPTVPPTNLPNPFAVAAPTGLTLVAGDAESIVSADGIRMPRIKVTWTRPSDPFLVNYQVQAKKTADAVWDEWGSPLSTETQFFVGPVTSESWDVRIRAINSIGVPSAWVSASVTPSVSSSITTFAKYRVENTPIASFEWRETDEVLPLGLWRAVLDADQWRLQKNTSAAGDFGTFSELLKVSATAFTFLAAAAVSMGRLTATEAGIDGHKLVHPNNGGTSQGAVEIGTAATVVSGDRSARLGFRGDGIQHGQIAWHAGVGFKFLDSSAAHPAGDYGANPTFISVFTGALTATSTAAIAGTVNRTGADGTIAQFQNDGVAALNIGTADVSPATAGGLTLGTALLPFGQSFFNGLMKIVASGVPVVPNSDTWLLVQSNVTTTNNARINIIAGSAAEAILEFGDSADVDAGAIQYHHPTDSLRFRTNALNDRMVITSGGNVLIGTPTDVAGVRLRVIGGDFELGSLGRFDSTDTPTDMQFLRYNASVAKWQADTLNTVVGTGDFHAALTGDGTAVAYVDENLAPADGAVNEPGVPTATAKHLSFELRIPGSYVKTANFKRFKWETCTGAGCVTWTHLIFTTSLSLIHARLTSGQVRRYRVRAESTTTVSAFATTGDVTVIAGSDTEAFGGIIGGDAVFVDLAALSGDFGIVKVGQMRNEFTSPTSVINFGGKGGIPSTVKRLINFEDTALPTWVDGESRAYLNLFQGGAAGNTMLRHDHFELRYTGTPLAIFRGIAQETDTSPKFKIDFPGKLLTVTDEQAPPQKRIEVGKFGAGGAYGMRLWDRLNNQFVDTDISVGSLDLAQLFVAGTLGGRDDYILLRAGRTSGFAADNDVAAIELFTNTLGRAGLYSWGTAATAPPISGFVGAELFSRGASILLNDADDRAYLWATGARSVAGGSPVWELDGTDPKFVFFNTTYAVDNRTWEIIGGSSAGNIFLGRVRNDADNAGEEWLRVTRGSGAVIDKIEFPKGKLVDLVKVIGRQNTSVDTGVNTTEITLHTTTIPAGAMGANGFLRISGRIKVTGTNNTKTVRFKFGGTVFFTVVYAAAETTGANAEWGAFEVLLYNRNATGTQGMGGFFVTTNDQVRGPVDTTIPVDSTLSQNITITGQTANSTDDIELCSALVELMYGA